MKKIATVALMPLLLSACSGGDDFIHSSEPRSNIYYGQTVADLYENFGTPTKATRFSENERVLIYFRQDIEKEWAYRYMHSCVMKVHLKDERVVDWSAQGTACVVHADPKPGSIIASIDDRGVYIDPGVSGTRKVISPYAVSQGNNTQKSYINVSSKGDTYFNGQHVPNDAFFGSTPTVYTHHANGYTSQTLQTNGQPLYKQYPTTLPADAFDGRAPIPVNPQAGYGTSQVVPNNSSVLYSNQLPADAFDGRASTTYQGVNQPVQGVYQPQPKQSSSSFFGSLFSTDDDEGDWGIFDAR